MHRNSLLRRQSNQPAGCFHCSFWNGCLPAQALLLSRKPRALDSSGYTTKHVPGKLCQSSGLAGACVHSSGACSYLHCGSVSLPLLLPACSAVWSHTDPTPTEHGPSVVQSTRRRLAREPPAVQAGNGIEPLSCQHGSCTALSKEWPLQGSCCMVQPSDQPDSAVEQGAASKQSRHHTCCDWLGRQRLQVGVEHKETLFSVCKFGLHGKWLCIAVAANSTALSTTCACDSGDALRKWAANVQVQPNKNSRRQQLQPAGLVMSARGSATVDDLMHQGQSPQEVRTATAGPARRQGFQHLWPSALLAWALRGCLGRLLVVVAALAEGLRPQ